MPEKKKENAKLQIVFSAMLLGLIFMVQLYSMINMPEQLVIIGLLGVLLLLALYVLIRSVTTEINAKQERREEQYDSIFKAEKASYLMLKKYFEEIEDTLEYIEKTSKVPTEEIVGTQKGIGKAIINRSRENAEAVISSNDQLVERMDEFNKLIEDNRAQIIETYRELGENNLQQMVMKQQDLIVNLKDMELRLNNAIMQSQKVIAASAPVMTAPIMQQAAPQMIPEPVAQPQPVVEPSVEKMPEPIPEPVVEAIPEPEPVVEAISEPEPIPDPVAEAVLEPEPIAEEKPPMPDLSDPNKVMSPDDIAALLANMPDDSESATEAEPEPEAIPEPAVEEKPPMPDLSDPNKMMSPDDIEALLASMSVDSIPAEEPEPIPEPPVEEKPPMPDLSDPNKKMSADDIAALFAAMG
jgi:hypothetical protein